MSHRPLAIVSALAVGDYLLWNWSLGANHEITALVSGLTLPPLAIVFVWLSVLSVARLIARSTLRSRADTYRELEDLRNAPEHAQPQAGSLPAPEPAGAPASFSEPSSQDKLAA